MDDEREQLLLAFAIASYATTHRSMTALMDAGLSVGYGTLGAVRRQLHQYAATWDSRYNGNLLWRAENLDRVVGEARHHCTIHQSEIDELTSRE
jgi:hypothetical protein